MGQNRIPVAPPVIDICKLFNLDKSSPMPRPKQPEESVHVQLSVAEIEALIAYHEDQYTMAIESEMSGDFHENRIEELKALLK